MADGQAPKTDPVLVTLRELHEDADAVLERIRQSGQPGFVTRHGLLAAMITPLPPGIKATVLAANLMMSAFLDAAEVRRLNGTATVFSVQETNCQLDVREILLCNVGETLNVSQISLLTGWGEEEVVSALAALIVRGEAVANEVGGVGFYEYSRNI